MSLKAVHVSDVPNLDQVQENATFSPCPSCCTNASIDDIGGDKDQMLSFRMPKKFVIMGHRGSGTNMLQSPNPRMKAIKENSIRSFNEAAKFDIDFIEFDVQLTKDGCPVIFHDIFILTEEQDIIIEKRVTELTLDEFQSYGPQEGSNKVGKPLFRKTKDGRIFEWKVEADDCLCTLEEAFQRVHYSVGFNIELKFDDKVDCEEDELASLLEIVLQVVFKHAKDRPIIFSSFHPDAALLIRKLQTAYPVLFLTNGGCEIYSDVRRNSLDEAIKLCLEGYLQGIVSEVKAILRNPGAVTKIKQSKLLLITYGQLNFAFASNVPQVVRMQQLLSVDGAIVDLIKEITTAVSDFNKSPKGGIEEVFFQQEGQIIDQGIHHSQNLLFFLRFIHELDETLK